MVIILMWTTFAILSITSLFVLFEFLREKALRAALISSMLLMCISSAWLVSIFLLSDYGVVLLISFWLLVAFGLILLFAPLGGAKSRFSHANERVDERTIMFARARYKKGDRKYERFYQDFPDLKLIDDFTRHLPNLGQPGSESFDHLNPKIALSLFDWIEKVRETVDGPVAETKIDMSLDEASDRLTGFARYLGAADAGTTKVHPSHVYSRIGRGAGEWGSEIIADEFKFALVFTIEMNEKMISATPLQPVLADSSRQYLEGAKIALVLAEYIRSLGYKARAHIDGNYRLIMPPLAVDAGLGEIGRHSLLITPREGSRVRIGAVTTDLPLRQSERNTFGVEDFCTVCKKCQRNCPTNALPDGDMEDIRGTQYWVMNPVRCYRYWRGVGTDCGLCVGVCPYSRPKGPLHSFVRKACEQSSISRRIFARLDDLFYGAKPRSRKYPKWMLSGLDSEERERLKIK